MPKPVVDRLGARGTSTTYLPDAVEIAAAIGRLSRRGLPFRTVAVSLFSQGYPVPDELLTAGFRTLVRRFAADFATIRAQLRPDVAGVDDLLADAEVMARRAIAGNGWSVRRMRHNLRANPPPDVTPANRDAVLEGVVASMVRFMFGELPESDDSLIEMVAAIGAQKAFEKARWAEAPLVSEEVGDLRVGLASSSLDLIVSLFDRVSAADLRHGRVIFMPVVQGLSQIPEPVRCYFGSPGDAVRMPLDTQMFAVLFMAGMLMWLSVDAAPEALYNALARNGRSPRMRSRRNLGTGTWRNYVHLLAYIQFWELGELLVGGIPLGKTNSVISTHRSRSGPSLMCPSPYLLRTCLTQSTQSRDPPRR
jgi:hypothetical protein